MQTDRNELYIPAPLGKRFLAFVVDAVIGGLVLFVLVGLFMAYMISAMLYLEWPLLNTILENATEATFYLWVLGVVLSFFWFAYYGLLRDSFKNGQSWGKRLLGLRVVELEGNRPCSKGCSFTRNFLGLSLAFIGVFLPFIGWPLWLVEPLAVITSKAGQRFGDRWARVQVVIGKLQEQRWERWER